MAYRKRYYRRRGMKSKGGPKLNKRQVKEVKNLIHRNIEVKSVCSFDPSTGFSYTGGFGTGFLVDPITLPALGTGYNQRAGAEIIPTELNFNYIIKCGDVYNLTRVLLIQWMDDAVLDAPTASEIFDPNSYSGAQQVIGQFLWPDRSKFKVLYDSLSTLVGSVVGTPSASNPAGPTSVRDHKVTVFGKKMRRIIGTTTIGGNYIGALYVVAISDSAITPNPTISWTARLKYRDA